MVRRRCRRLAATGWSPSNSRIGRAVGGGGGPPRRTAAPPTAAAAGTRSGAAVGSIGRRHGGACACTCAVPAAQGFGAAREGAGHRRIATGLGGRLARHGHPEDGRRDAVADEAAQLVVQLERFALEFVERILLRIAPQADAAAHVVELGQVLDPQRVDRSDEDQPLDGLPVLLADLGRLGRQALVGYLADVFGDRIAPAEVPQLVGRGARTAQAHRHEGCRQPLEVPRLRIVTGQVAVHDRVHLVIEE